MKKLEMVKKLVKQGNIQKALDKLSELTLESNNIELADVFMKRYQTGESIYSNMEDLNESCVDIEPDGTIYEYERLNDDTLMVIDVTKESIMKAVNKIESILKIA